MLCTIAHAPIQLWDIQNLLDGDGDLELGPAVGESQAQEEDQKKAQPKGHERSYSAEERQMQHALQTNVRSEEMMTSSLVDDILSSD